MIKSIRLRNFRGYRDSGVVELKPLTVLLGPNSAGKSSFGQALAALSFANWSYSGGSNVSLTPKNFEDAKRWPVDLGTHSDLVTSGVDDKVYVGLETPQGWVEYGFGPVQGEKDRALRPSFISYPGNPQSSGMQEVEIKTVPSTVIEGASTGSSAISFTAAPKGIRLTRKPSIEDVQLWDDDGQSTRVTLDGLLLTSLQHSAGGTSLYVDRPTREDLRELFDGLSYLRAVRKPPTRLDREGVAEPQRIGYDGEWATSILYELAGSNELIGVRFPNAIPNTLDQAAAVLDAPWKNEELRTLPALSAWLARLGLATDVVGIKSSVEIGRIETKVTMVCCAEQRNITEVGFGISQVLPVLLLGLTQRSSSTFVVELPEAHLHPRAQAELADFFCSLVESGCRCIVETHSEMFFHRLRLRAAMNTDLMEKIGVYFCDAPSAELGCNPPRAVRLDIGDQIPWPAGFLQEGWEMEEQISLIRQARKGKRA